MPFTELIKPSLVQSDEARDAFSNIIVPSLRTIITSAPGFVLGAAGHKLIENNVAVAEPSFNPILGIEWEDSKYFHDFVKSEQFPTLIAQLKPHTTAPAWPEVYETDVSPKDIFASPIIEVFRININEDSEKENAAKTAWEAFAKALKGTHILSGVSVNLPERFFLGLIGWSGIEQRKMAMDNVEHLKQAVDSLKDSQSFVAELNTVV
ncbi:hypothetical protein EAE99_011701 [Botrytis elliptica]|nr:hypothetical protein EAE99_011701 [Botrytis elliptica]